MAGTTPNYALRFPDLTDTPDGATQIHNLASDVDAALATASAPPVVATYTPAVGGSGGATWAIQTGWYFRLGKQVFFCAYLHVNAPGSGSSLLTVTAPSSIDRSTRQVFACHAENMQGGSGAHAVGVALSLASGTGAIIDKMLVSGVTSTFAHAGLIGSDVNTGGYLTIQGTYREA